MATIRNLLLRLGVDVDPLDRGFAKAAKAVSTFDKRFSKVAKVGAVGAGLGAATGAATAMTAALAPAAGALVALPGAMAMSKAAAGTLKVGLMGVSEAMGALAEGNAEKLKDALAVMSPEARKFVMATKGIVGALSPIRSAVQDALFAGMAKQVAPLAKNLMPTLKTGMVGVASSMNAGAKEAAAFGRTDFAKGALAKIFKSTQFVMESAATAVRPVLKGITSLVLAGLPLAERMAGWAINGAKAAGAFMASKEGAEKLAGWAVKAGNTLSQLGQIGKNLGGFLGGIFKGAKGSGDGVLDTLEEITAKMSAFTQSTGGQERLSEAFRLLLEILRAVVGVLPIFMGPLGAIMTLLTSMSPEVRGVVVQFLAFSVVGVALAGKLSGLLGVVKGVTVGVVGAGAAAVKFGSGLISGTAGLDKNAGAAAKAGAAVRSFGSLALEGVKTTSEFAMSMGKLALEKGKVAAQAALAATKQGLLTAAQIAGNVASKALAVGIRLVNAAMRANPIGIVITILIALVGAIVLAYNKNETFRKIVQNVWKAIQSAISFAWNNVIKPAFNAIVSFITGTLVPKMNWLYNNVIKPVWNGIKTAISTVWNSGIKPVFTALATFITKTVPNAFQTGVKAIGTFWDKVKAIAKAPVTFLVNTVYNNGIRKIWNWVASKVGLGQLDEIRGFARGGVLPGYSRKDNQLIAARSGEGILVPEAVKGLGGAPFIYGVNALARSGGAMAVAKKLGVPGFENGGVVGWVGSFFSKAKDFFVNGFMKAAGAALNPIVNLARNSMDGTPFGSMLAGAVNKIVGGVLTKFKPFESELGGGGATGVVKAAIKYLGQGDERGIDNNNQFNRNWGFGVGTPWCANFVSTAIRDAKAGGKYPGYPTAAVYGYWSRMSKVGLGNARPGDLAVHGGPTTHINMVETPLKNGSYRTIGGNEGPYVRRSTRSSAYSILRPAFERGGILDPKIYRQRNLDPRDRNDPWRKLMARTGRGPWASVMDGGGIIRPGWNAPIYNGTGRTEGVFTADQMKAMAGGRGGNTYHIAAQVAPGTSPAEVGRQIVTMIKEYERTNGTRWRGNP